MSRDGLLAAARLLTLRVGKGETASKTSGEEDEADEDWAPEFCNNALQGELDKLGRGESLTSLSHPHSDMVTLLYKVR